MIQSPVLVLNASYEPIAVCLARRAMTMIVKGVARVEESHDQFIHREMKLPSVIRLSAYRRVPSRRHTVSRKNIFLRDRHMCQYCLAKFSGLRLTLDHVVPRSRGGASVWENLVACCSECNRRKADRTPAEAGMELAAVPRAMNLHTARNILRRMGEEDVLWRKYLYF